MSTLSRRAFIGGNWKMHGSLGDSLLLLQQLFDGRKGKEGAEIGIFPPFVYLQHVRSLLNTAQNNQIKGFVLGAQNVNEHSKGAYTGEISAEMLDDVGCEYALIGHSERRNLYGETNEQIAKKCLSALQNKVKPVLCIGETLEQKNAGKTIEILLEQLNSVICVVGLNALRHCVLAYEPVWAIGTGLAASPMVAQEIHAKLRAYLSEQNVEISEELRIIYGGSVKADNAQDFSAMPDIDGALVGGASLKAEEFLNICHYWG